MLKASIEDLFKAALKKAIDNSELGELKEVPDTIPVELPKNPEHGDRAVSIAMRLAKDAKIAPRQIAQAIVDNIDKSKFNNIELAGPGFINISLDWSLLEDCIVKIHNESENYGRATAEERPDKSFSKVLVEYVSANPTGDLHIGHGRQAVLGSALAELLKWAGYEVESEFYINDAGAQMEKLAKSAQDTILVRAGLLDIKDYPEDDRYPFESIDEFFLEENYEKEFLNRGIDLKKDLVDLEKARELVDLDLCASLAKEVFLKAQEEVLKKINVVFDTWYSEKEKLHSSDNKVAKACEVLGQQGHTYEEEGALWLKAKDLGDERNRVLMKSNGLYTYLAADIAYHQDKIARSFDKLINVWGADHHGQEPSLKAGLAALGEPASRLEIVFIQMVSLSQNGEEVKMSKRAGTIVNVRDLYSEVGADALRYFLVESQANNHMVFDLELAKKQDKDNPVYYIQYAHARSCSILRTLIAEQINQDSEPKLEKAIMSKADLEQLLENNFKQNQALFSKAFANLSPEELNSTKDLILHLVQFPEEVKEAAFARAPYKIANYAKELATLFHQFYSHNRVMVDDKDLMKARISLVVATQKVIKNALRIIAISAPEKM